MAIVNSRATLEGYCLRRLGDPVVEINVDPYQIADRIDEALQYYQEYHSDAIVKTYVKHEVTQIDFDNKWIDIPDRMIFVKNIFRTSGVGSGGNLFNFQYHYRMEDMLLLGHNMNLADWIQREQYVSLIDQQLNGAARLTFNRHMNRLRIDGTWSTDYPVGAIIVVEGYETVDPDTYPDVYNDRFLKKYATALIKQQWGQNLIKFEGLLLPGGVMLNGRQIYDDATAEIEQIEEAMQLAYEMPVDFEVG